MVQVGGERVPFEAVGNCIRCGRHCLSKRRDSVQSEAGVESKKMESLVH